MAVRVVPTFRAGKGFALIIYSTHAESPVTVLGNAAETKMFCG